MALRRTRRRFLETLSFAGSAALLGIPRASGDDLRQQTTSIRLARHPAIGFIPRSAVDERLRAEGFIDIRYPDANIQREAPEAIARGKADFALGFIGDHIQAIDGGAPIVVLAGIHAGLYELFVRPGIRHPIQLDGKRVGLKAASPVLLYLIAANVGLRPPHQDIPFLPNALELFIEGKIDAFLGFPPESQELRQRHVGEVLINTTVDPPWSQHFCCALAGNKAYVQKYPLATQRVLNAIISAADYCATDPKGAAQRLIDEAVTTRYDYALQAVKAIPYSKWRDHDSADMMQFYTRRMREAGLIKTDPSKIIAENADWRFIDQLTRGPKSL
jgi:NitT/TauT family transport system substrate-binding protein